MLVCTTTMATVRKSHSYENGWPLFGHGWAVQLLQQVISGPGLRHAYLVTGPRHVGKTTLVRAFASSLLCTESEHIACGHCRSCRLMASGNHPDYRVLQPLDREGETDRSNGQLRSESATDLVRDVAIKPYESRYKLFFLQDVHRANDSFLNKILKTLEEPPDHAILCLTATDRSQLLPTIVSRCQVLPLRPVDSGTIERALLETTDACADDAALLARICAGRPGWAYLEHEDRQQQQVRREELERLHTLVQADRIERLHFAEKLASSYKSQRLFGMLELWTVWWRDVLLSQSGCPEACSNIDYLERIGAQSQSIPVATVRRYLQTLRRIEDYLHHTVNVRLALEVLLLELPHTA